MPAIVGAAGGFLMFKKTPETFRASTRLIVESDRPAILDSMTGDVIGGVPSVDILRSHLYSDRFVKMAFDNPVMIPLQERFGGDPSRYNSTARGGLSLVVEGAGGRAAQSFVAVLSFEHSDAELCEASVKAFSDAMQTFFNERQKSSRTELLQLISVAIEQLHPKMTDLEKQYRDFRRDAPLAWDSQGQAINPHRESQLFLTGKRSELVEQMRQKATQLAAVESVYSEAKDHLVAMAVISRLLDVNLELTNVENELARNLVDADVELAELKLDQQLVPLMIERNKMANEFGASHPTVKQLDTELALMKSELRRIVIDQTKRMVELRKENEIKAVDPKENAKEAISAVLIAAKAELDLLKNQISELDKQIADEKAAAITLAKFEQDNVAMLREINRNRELMNQLEEQMARVSLTEEEGGTQVLELTAPSKAGLVGPNLARTLSLGTFLGLAIGAGLALLLEINANTFRNPEEISSLLAVPVLTHIPFFKGRIRKPKKGKSTHTKTWTLE
ncbi:hypothetical protein [Novipirellula maiorica]|uniref:GumC family protein n=1 Tax=Novipirellula maiorica TaxID=1265734 RepID=UPI0028F41F03|nr:hypothetical protein [Rhodopirellula maiorica]